ncbi:uncharacterized protein LOC133850252 isoform X1 [Drosophila sulfurigaster albostrigata]|uniref:Uncharacterized protein LOC117565824 isoform X1 n=1 Tax=Drosophila albomicans TaxID=7291 RepID=A0A6P8XTC5_DROAB|nr:uncharacterized protein LOC117565824 isoform X1 [Drosophila albomicans]XP_034101020.1 uncharacterized protein LOC117565824 isoform X1 [Drosophila albomicans]XP_034101021.1 uncharacterized protein LOC117565824 isoform X1 [Drosophila albomicans]XP_034101022.1 uncharacterized protein LOC117565824 isoform X1 [Drosophila albomicans]XP_062142276.1 uncharacterized protein LOC133850252 isoform X1 [Drosophila sulfurigaster albostrigata]XP_062142277.1 uncharacterized protein LOC133850252 isoform X1 [
MAEKVEISAATFNNNNQQNDARKVRKSPDFQPMMPGVISRERSFVRTSNQQNINKRRSLAFNVPGNQAGQMRGKPAMDIYRPPNVRGCELATSVSNGGGGGASVASVGGGIGGGGNKLNINAQEFTMTPPPSAEALENNRSSLIFPQQYVTTATAAGQHNTQNAAILNRRQAGLSLGNMSSLSSLSGRHRSILVTHPISPLGGQLPLMNSPSSGNILHSTNRVKFAPEPRAQKPQTQYVNSNGQQHYNSNGQQHYQLNGLDPYLNGNALQRSKSLSSADALTRGMAGLGLGLGNEVADIGQFTPEIQALIDTALEDPNKLNSRCLMELTSQFIKRAVESRRFALPISRLCLNIIAKEQKETFLEALLNTCRQWYQEREKLLFAIQGMKSPSRVRFTAFMAFLTEMFCQLKRRQLQLRTHSEGTPPPLVLLSLLSKCCEDCVRPPVRSLSEIECLFYVLTCIGQDMEQQLPQQLELLMSLVRDAFLNAGDAAAAIRRTLLQLIELKASHWQLPGNTVLYYTHTNN